jgi:hypothetical protein
VLDIYMESLILEGPSIDRSGRGFGIGFSVQEEHGKERDDMRASLVSETEKGRRKKNKRGRELRDGLRSSGEMAGLLVGLLLRCCLARAGEEKEVGLHGARFLFF